jgi:hypothetical protein
MTCLRKLKNRCGAKDAAIRDNRQIFLSDDQNLIVALIFPPD